MHEMHDASGFERMLINRAEERRLPIHGSLELTPLCNLNCAMCYVRLSRAEMARRGRLRTAQEWLEIGRQMKESGVLFLLLTGGEPLTHPEFKAIYLGLRRMGFLLTINTNGTLIDEAWADFFAQNPLRRINITLYGADAQTYARLCGDGAGFDRVLRGVRLLRQRHIDVKLAASLTPDNAAQMEQIHAIGEALGVPVRMDSYMMPARRERERPFDRQSRMEPVAAARLRVAMLRREMGEERFARHAQESLRRIDEAPARPAALLPMTCLAGSCSFAINWQGEMRPCVVMTMPSAPVFELGFAQSWKAIRAETASIATGGACAACRLRPVCRTCAAAALLETGGYDGVPQYLCRMAEETERLMRAESKAT